MTTVLLELFNSCALNLNALVGSSGLMSSGFSAAAAQHFVDDLKLLCPQLMVTFYWFGAKME